MDILGEAISSVRVGRAEACWVAQSGAWGLRYAENAVSGFHILIRGSAWLITPHEPPRELTPGDIVLTPHGGEHGLSHTPCRFEHLPPAVLAEGPPSAETADAALLCGAYWLTYGQVHPYLRALPEVIAMSPDYDRNPHLRSLADVLAADVSRAAPGSAATRPALLDLMLTHALREWLAQHPTGHSPEISDPAVAAALHEIHTNPGLPWTVQQLSDRAGMPRPDFSKRFTAAIGQPPRAYLTGWRLSYGARLLRESDAPLAAIARRVGYSTPFAFGEAFRREYGISPGRFRKHESSA